MRPKRIGFQGAIWSWLDYDMVQWSVP